MSKITCEKDIYRLWGIGFSTVALEWTKWNAPYFEDYTQYTYEDFLEKETFYKKENTFGIFVNQQLIGGVFRYYIDEKTRWLEVGIVIYDVNYWDDGYRTIVLKEWITKTFMDYPEIEHIGLTTWSGNLRMRKCVKKLEMLQEACIRRVRYWQGVYYDSVKYGVLRDEWLPLY